MAKRTTRTQTPKLSEPVPEATATPAEPERPKTKRSRTTADEPVETADDSAAAQAATSATSESPSEDDIRDSAYHRYLQRGGGHGMDFDDWLEAERELKKG